MGNVSGKLSVGKCPGIVRGSFPRGLSGGMPEEGWAECPEGELSGGERPGENDRILMYDYKSVG